MSEKICDCMGCDYGVDCVKQAEKPEPTQQEQYVEARFTLIEELFSQLFGFFPPDAAEALAAGYNERRGRIRVTFNRSPDESKELMDAAKAIPNETKLILPQKSGLILP